MFRKKRMRKAKDANHDMIHINQKCYPVYWFCHLTLGRDAILPNMKFWSEKCRVLWLGLRHCSCHLLHMHQQRVDYIFLTIRLPQPPKIKRKKAKDVLGDKLPNRNNVECTYLPFATLQWGAADAEIKVPSGENTLLPFKVWSRSVYSHTCYAYCQEFLPRLFLPFRAIHLHFFQNLSQFFPVLAVANTGSCVGPQSPCLMQVPVLNARGI